MMVLLYVDDDFCQEKIIISCFTLDGARVSHGTSFTFAQDLGRLKIASSSHLAIFAR